MKNCPACKSELDDDSLYCDQCSYELKVCPQCNLLGRGKRCAQCGAVLITLSKPKDDSLYLVNQPLGIRLEVFDDGIVGRKEGDYADILADQSYISGIHAKFNFDKAIGNWNITDLESTNGTFINEKRLCPNVPHIILRNDRIKIGIVEFIIE